MDAGFIEWIIGQSGTAAVAALSLWMLNRSYQDSLRRERENSESHREDKRQLIEALQSNAKALTALEAACERIQKSGS